MATKEEIKKIVEGVPIGAGMTGTYWTDGQPFVVVRKTAQKLFIKEAKVGEHNRAQWPDQDWEVFLDQPIGPEISVSFIKQGWKAANGMKMSWGARKYLDPSF